MNAHKFFPTNSSIILIIFIVISTGTVLAAFLLFSSSHTYPWIGMKFTFWIYHLIQQESTQCFLNYPNSFRFDEVLFIFQICQQQINTNILIQCLHGIRCKKLLLMLYVLRMFIVLSSWFLCKNSACAHIHSIRRGWFLCSVSNTIYIYICYEIFMLFE